MGVLQNHAAQYGKNAAEIEQDSISAIYVKMATCTTPCLV